MILNGTPGTAWTNDGDTVMYQAICSLWNTCGTCLQYHHAIAAFFPFPIHRNCACRSEILAPGATARPWVDFRQIVRDLPASQQDRVFGRATYRLLESGKIKWDDAVTSARVRPLHEIISNVGLSLKALMAAGVSRATAERMLAGTRTSDAAATERHRQELIGKLKNSAMQDGRIGNTDPIASKPSNVPVGWRASLARQTPPGPVIVAGKRILDRIKGVDDKPDPLPDFGGSMVRLQTYLNQNYSESSLERLSKDDWLALAAMLAAEQDLRARLKRIGADVDKAMKEVK